MVVISKMKHGSVYLNTVILKKIWKNVVRSYLSTVFVYGFTNWTTNIKQTTNSVIGILAMSYSDLLDNIYIE